MGVLKMGIKKAAEIYSKLTDYEYRIILVRNKHSSPVNVSFNFEKDGFSHLCGLHKLTDINMLNSYKNRKNVIDKIIDGTYSDSLFEQSAYYDNIKDRIECLEMLDDILDNSNSVFKFNHIKRKSTLINFDFLIKYTDQNGHHYYLTIEDSQKQGSYCGCSCFGRTLNDDDYAKGHTAYYILQKTKINIKTKEEEQLYIAPSYKKQLEAESSTAAHDVKTNIKKIEFAPLPVSPVITLDRPKFPFSFSDFFQKIKRAFRHFLSYFKPKKPQASAQKRSSHSRTRT